MKAEVFIGLNLKEQISHVNERKLNGVTFRGIYDRVCKHFKVDTLKEKPKGRTKAPMREIFYMIVFENFIVPEAKGGFGCSTIYRILGELTGRDRTSVYHYHKNFYETGMYLNPTGLKYNGDFHLNHFYNIKKAVNGNSSVSKKNYITHKRVRPNTKFLKAMEDYRADILNAISRGEDLSYINNRFVGYSDVPHLRSQINLYTPGLLRLMRYHDRKIKEMLR